MNHPAEKVGRTLGLSVGAGRLNLKNTFPLERHILTRTPQPTSQKGCTRIRDSPVLNAQHSSCSQPQLFGERESQTDNSHSQLRQTFWCDVCVCVCVPMCPCTNQMTSSQMHPRRAASFTHLMPKTCSANTQKCDAARLDLCATDDVTDDVTSTADGIGAKTHTTDLEPAGCHTKLDGQRQIPSQ